MSEIYNNIQSLVPGGKANQFSCHYVCLKNVVNDLHQKGHAMTQSKPQHLAVIIIPGSGPALIGLNCLKQIKLDWKKVFQLNNIKSKGAQVEKKIDGIISKYALVFSPGISTKKEYKDHIEMLTDSIPHYNTFKICITASSTITLFML